jgi:hypothetical protein
MSCVAILLVTAPSGVISHIARVARFPAPAHMLAAQPRPRLMGPEAESPVG